MRINSELLDAQLENKASDVTPATTAKGLVYYKSTTEPLKVSDGTTVHKVYTDQMKPTIASDIQSLVAINQSQVAANYGLSASCGTYFMSSAAYEDVTNLSVTITTTGKPVHIVLVNGHASITGANVNTATGYVKLLRGVTDISAITMNTQDADRAATADPQVFYPSGSFAWVDTPAAGTYTYKVQIKSLTTATTTAIIDSKLFVKEIV